MKLCQSMSATTSSLSPSVSARWSAASATAGSIGNRPCRRSCRPTSPCAMPAPDQGPQATDVAESPRARRAAARASRWALAAA